MSTMIDENAPIPIDNIRSLLYILSEALDGRLKHYRKGTRYETVRPSDIRVFMAAWRQPQTVSQIARALNVSRQAVHMSIKRLAALGVVGFDPSSPGKRDKNLVVTDRGHQARHAAQQQVVRLEAECEAVIGADGMMQLRSLLVQLCRTLADEGSLRISSANG